MINASIEEPQYDLKPPLLLRAIHRSGMVVLATEIREVTFDGYVLMRTDRTFYALGEMVEQMELDQFEAFRGELKIGNVPVNLSPAVVVATDPPFIR